MRARNYAGRVTSFCRVHQLLILSARVLDIRYLFLFSELSGLVVFGEGLGRKSGNVGDGGVG